MAVTWPAKNNYATGDILTAANMNGVGDDLNDLYNKSTVQGSAAGKNAVINGGFDIWQRGTSLAIGSSSVTWYGPDRWQIYRGATGSTVSRQATGDTTNLPNIQYCMRIQRDSGNTSTAAIAPSQTFETVNSIPFAGKTVTLSFYARAGANYSASAGNLLVQVITGTGTDQNLQSGFTGASTPVNTNATLTTTWQKFTYSATLSSTATQLAVGFTFTPVGTAGANDYFEITGVQLELGSSATVFARNGATIQGELAACQRYYWRKSNSSNANPWFANGVAYSGGTALYTGINCPVTMRVSPTSLDYASLRLDNGGSAFTVSSFAISTTQSTPDNLAVVVGTTGTTSGNTYNISGNGTGNYIGASAEL